MGKRHIPEAHTAHPNVTPLIDIVMCLIIFFMLVAKIGVNTGADEMPELPESIVGTDIKDMGNALVLNIYERPGNDMPQVTALVKGPGGEQVKQELQLIDPATQRKQLLDTLRFYRYGQDGKQGGDGANIDNPEFKGILRGSGDMAYKSIEPVLITCAEANVKNVNFNTKKVETTN